MKSLLLEDHAELASNNNYWQLDVIHNRGIVVYNEDRELFGFVCSTKDSITPLYRIVTTKCELNYTCISVAALIQSYPGFSFYMLG